MKYQKIFYAVSFLLLCILGNSIYPDAKCENIIESNISEFQNKTNCNSVNIVVYDDGKVSYYGNDKEDGLYQIGSMTKAFTGLGIMKLVREGNIVKGTRLGYWKAYNFDMVVREGAIPAGYFYSNINDMCRWLEIWLGQADIPAVYKELIEETRNCLNQEHEYYAGWEYFGEGGIGHSEGTANYSSRIVFSKEKNVGVCVLTNLNVAASTDRLCNDILAITIGKETAGFSYDIWTVFDNIFSVITIIGSILLFAIITKLNNIRAMIVSDVVGVVILAGIFITMPAIFQSGWGEILFVWAPWSILGGIIVLLLDVTVLSIKIWRWKKHENHNKKS